MVAGMRRAALPKRKTVNVTNRTLARSLALLRQVVRLTTRGNTTDDGHQGSIADTDSFEEEHGWVGFGLQRHFTRQMEPDQALNSTENLVSLIDEFALALQTNDDQMQSADRQYHEATASPICWEVEQPRPTTRLFLLVRCCAMRVSI